MQHLDGPHGVRNAGAARLVISSRSIAIDYIRCTSALHCSDQSAFSAWNIHANLAPGIGVIVGIS